MHTLSHTHRGRSARTQPDLRTYRPLPLCHSSHLCMGRHMCPISHSSLIFTVSRCDYESNFNLMPDMQHYLSFMSTNTSCHVSLWFAGGIISPMAFISGKQKMLSATLWQFFRMCISKEKMSSLRNFNTKVTYNTV